MEDVAGRLSRHILPHIIYTTQMHQLRHQHEHCTTHQVQGDKTADHHESEQPYLATV